MFKLAIQELTKLYVLKKRVRSTRIMCMLVEVPTVLLDTQTRMILIGCSSTQTAVKGVLGMALIEISVRAKCMWTLKFGVVRCTQQSSTLICMSSISLSAARLLGFYSVLPRHSPTLSPSKTIVHEDGGN